MHTFGDNYSIHLVDHSLVHAFHVVRITQVTHLIVFIIQKAAREDRNVVVNLSLTS